MEPKVPLSSHVWETIVSGEIPRHALMRMMNILHRFAARRMDVWVQGCCVYAELQEVGERELTKERKEP